MRHRVAGRKLNKSGSHRRAMMRNMVTSLIDEERIETTLPKAKELRRVAERMVTLGKKGTLHARRQALSYVRREESVKKLFGELTERFAERAGGYTRIMKIGPRFGDNAPIVLIEYLGAKPKPSAAERKEEAAKSIKAKKGGKKDTKKDASKDKKAVKKAKTDKRDDVQSAKKQQKAEPQKKRGMFGSVFRRKSD
jgi:large subunit ribosomal protein L17